VYIFNQGSKTFSILPSTFASLVALDTNEKSDTYGLGQTLTINAIFNRKIKE